MKKQRLLFSRLMFLAVVVAASAIAMVPVDLSGTWSIELKHDHPLPSAFVPVALVLKHEASKVTGILALPQGMQNGGDLPLTGEFADGTIALGTTEDYTGPMKMKMNGRILEDGAMAGNMEIRSGDHTSKLTWSAERKKRQSPDK